MRKKIAIFFVSLCCYPTFSLGCTGGCIDPPTLVALNESVWASYETLESTLSSVISEVDSFMKKNIVEVEKVNNKIIASDVAVSESVAISQKHLAFVSAQNVGLENIANQIIAIGAEGSGDFDNVIKMLSLKNMQK